MPWIHLHVGNRGQVNACCVAHIPFGNINKDSFDTIWNGKPIEALREKFAAGQSDPRCAVCLKREQGGASSMRLETFEKFGDKVPKDFTYPRYFDIRFSNVCNFRCRTCWHGASSKWFSDAQKLGRTAGKQAIINNIQDLDQFIEAFGPALRQAGEIYFAGGEPLVTTAHYLLLEWLVAEEVFPRLRYNTNFSLLTFKKWEVIDLWQKFEHVEIMASIDAPGKKGEYIRKELNWQQFLDNRKRLAKEAPNIHFKIAPTVSILNVKELPDFYFFAVKAELIQPDQWYINLLSRPFYYNIKALPTAIKQEVAQHYNTFFKQERAVNIPAQQLTDFKGIIDFMWSEDLSKHYPKFLEETSRLDQIRLEEMPID